MNRDGASQVLGIDGFGEVGGGAEERHGRDDVALEAAVSRLSLEPSISSVTWNASEPDTLAVLEE